jgi:CRP-like cAMP-binding protein
MVSSHIEPRMERRSYAAGREIFGQGDLGDCAYLVESGQVTIYHHLDGMRVELGAIGPGEIFGEMAAIDGGLRMAAAVAASPTMVTRIPKDMFDRKLAETDKFIRGLLNFFIRIIRTNHRTFVRRPRSVADHLLLMGRLAEDLGAFTGRLKDTAAEEGMRAALVKYEAAVESIRRAAANCPDPRHDLVVEEGADAQTDRMAARRDEAKRTAGP